MNVYKIIIIIILCTVVCEPPCVQGACVANDTCNCAEGYEGDQCTEAGLAIYSYKFI